VEKQTGRRPKELEGPEFPYQLAHLWSAYTFLRPLVPSGFNGPEPITPTFIKDWCEITTNDLKPWEVEIIFLVDRRYLNVARS